MILAGRPWYQDAIPVIMSGIVLNKGEVCDSHPGESRNSESENSAR